MSGYQFVTADTVSGSELIGAGGLMAAVASELKAAKIEGHFDVKLARSWSAEADLCLIVMITLSNGIRMPILARPWALSETQHANAARMLRNRWKEANARCDALADVLARARPRLESALDYSGGAARLIDLGLGTQNIEQGINMRLVAIRAEIESLDHRLQLERTIFDHETVADIIDEIKDDAKRQRARNRQRVKLDAAGAKFEIDAIAEAAILASGRTVADVADILIAGDELVQLPRPAGDSEARLSAYLSEGHVRLVGWVGDNTRKCHFVDRDLVIRPALTSHEIAMLGGRPAHELIDDPVLRPACKIKTLRETPDHTELAVTKVRSKLYTVELSPSLAA